MVPLDRRFVCSFFVLENKQTNKQHPVDIQQHSLNFDDQELINYQEPVISGKCRHYQL